MIDRFPDREYRVPYRGMDYFYSGGYWYRPLGPRYVVVEPPRGIRVSYLPDYAEQVLIGGAVLFLAAGAYYAYQESTQDYVVVEPPVGSLQPQPQSRRHPPTTVMTWWLTRPTASPRSKSIGMATSVINTRYSRVASIREPRPTSQTLRWCKPIARLRAIA